jgi:L-2-hydroxyglutarate oxidase LhgO
MIDVDCAVIGAGVVGLAVARALARSGRETLVLEAADAIGTGLSSRNSEVMHAGIYYEPGSLKATLCVAGQRALYAWCAERGVPFRRLGKLVVASDDAEVAQLRRVEARAVANGVGDLAWLDGDAVRALEPELSCVAALSSPSTGIVDSHALMRALRADAEDAGAIVALRSPVSSGDVDGLRLETPDGAVRCRAVVNSAGLAANRVAASLRGMPEGRVPPLYLAKGSYFSLAGKAPFRRLVYPTPGTAGLGVHLTLDLAGRARFGPDVEWVDHEDYTVDPARGDAFYERVRRYWPGLEDGRLRADYAGIRPKLGPPGAPAADFVIQGFADHGVPGLVNLFGIESPGLTACLALADRVAALVS